MSDPDAAVRKHHDASDVPPSAGTRERIFHPVQTYNVANTAPEAIVLRAYEVYCHVFGPQPAMIDVAKGCRGGFSVGELVAFLYARSFPREEWRDRVDEGLERSR